jgi:hypothetical protein
VGPIEMGQPCDDQSDDGPLREAALERLVTELAGRRAQAQLRPRRGARRGRWRGHWEADAVAMDRRGPPT